MGLWARACPICGPIARWPKATWRLATWLTEEPLQKSNTPMNTRLLRYYRSTTWRHHPARAEALARAGGRCQGCNATAPLECHHRYYPQELGTETVDALTVLCRRCHRAITSRIRRERYQRRLLRLSDTPRQHPRVLPTVWQSGQPRLTPRPQDTHRQRPGIIPPARKETLHVPRPPLHDTRRRPPAHA
jgi:hypothetical protein